MISILCHLESLRVTLLSPSKTILVFGLEYLKTVQGVGPVAIPTP
jgi:hypothetical protein